MIIATSILGTPYKFCRTSDSETGVWVDFLSHDTSTKILTLYYSEEKEGFNVASGGKDGWAKELFIKLHIKDFSSFTLTFEAKNAKLKFTNHDTYDFALAPGLSGGGVAYMRWGPGVIPPLSLVPAQSPALSSSQEPIPPEIQEDLPVEYFVLAARLKRLEDAFLKAGIGPL